MPNDATALGFAWPEATTITNPEGASLNIRPSHVRARPANSTIDRREGESFREYATDRGNMTELDLKYWYAGGADECRRFVDSFKTILQVEPEGMLLSKLVDALSENGFHNQTLEVNFRWLLIDGYISAEPVGDGFKIKIARW